MVMLRLDHNILSDINGRGNGGNYRRNWCGFKWQGNSTKKRNSTPAQKFINGIFGQAFRFWQHYPSKLTEEERNSWKTYARNHPIKNKKGETKPTTDRNAFISYNTGLLQSGQAIQTMAPPPEWTPRPLPLADINVVGFVTTEIILTFCEPMNIFAAHLPNIDQFWYRPRGYYAFHPSEMEWLNEYTLKLYFATCEEPESYARFGYVRGGNDLIYWSSEFVRNFEINVHL